MGDAGRNPPFSRREGVRRFLGTGADHRGAFSDVRGKPLVRILEDFSQFDRARRQCLGRRIRPYRNSFVGAFEDAADFDGAGRERVGAVVYPGGNALIRCLEQLLELIGAAGQHGGAPFHA